MFTVETKHASGHKKMGHANVSHVQDDKIPLFKNYMSSLHQHKSLSKPPEQL